MTCNTCGIEFERRADAKFCSPKCRVTFSRNKSVVTDNVVLAERIIEPEITFEFTIVVGKNNPQDVRDDKNKIRKAKYWYDVPIAAVPVIKKGWPKMPDYMNGRQYFLWWKNNFEESDKGAVIHNPNPHDPSKGEVKYEMGGETARRWGA